MRYDLENLNSEPLELYKHISGINTMIYDNNKEYLITGNIPG